jgi:hypothetical protein
MLTSVAKLCNYTVMPYELFNKFNCLPWAIVSSLCFWNHTLHINNYLHHPKWRTWRTRLPLCASDKFQAFHIFFTEKINTETLLFSIEFATHSNDILFVTDNELLWLLMLVACTPRYTRSLHEILTYCVSYMFVERKESQLNLNTLHLLFKAVTFNNVRVVTETTSF